MRNWLKKLEIVCTIIIVAVILLWAGYKWAGLELSDTVIRLMGIANLITLPLLVYAKEKLRLSE